MKLHLGCGKRYIPGFIHIDIGNYEHLDFKHSIDKLIFIENDSVDYIYASHVLDYFNKEKVYYVLKEWHRVLKVGGMLRFAVPDFKALCELYSSDESHMSFISGVLAGKMISDSEFIYHKSFYDFKLLSSTLSLCCFKDIKLWDWRKIPKDEMPTDDWSKSYVPHMDFENGKLISLNVECVKW